MTMIKFIQPHPIRRSFLFAAFFVCLAMASLQVRAQYIPQYSAFSDGLNIGFKAGVQGIALELNYPFLEKFNIRGSVNTFPLGEVTFRGSTYELKRTNIIGQIDYQPLYGKDIKFADKWFVSIGGSLYDTGNNSFRRQFNSGNDGYTLRFSRATFYLGTGLSALNLSDDFFLKIDLGYFIPVLDQSVSQRNDPTGEKAARTKSDWTSAPRVLATNMNLSLGIFYVLPFGRKY